MPDSLDSLYSQLTDAAFGYGDNALEEEARVQRNLGKPNPLSHESTTVPRVAQKVALNRIKKLVSEIRSKERQ